MGRFQMLVNEWVESFWAVLNVRPKTLHDYKRLYILEVKRVLMAYQLVTGTVAVCSSKN
jgi:hypothetical protein